MTAERTADAARWPIPPQEGYTADDLFAMPILPRHTELIDGSLVFMALQRLFHSEMIDLLVQALRSAQPSGLLVRREMAVTLTRQTVLEPDVSVVHAASRRGSDQVSFEPADVVLAVEVVSPSSRERDHDTKPHKYAGARIPHLWLIEEEGARVVASTYRLDDHSGEDGPHRYLLSGTFVNRLATDQPFPVDIDLTAAGRL